MIHFFFGRAASLRLQSWPSKAVQLDREHSARRVSYQRTRLCRSTSEMLLFPRALNLYGNEGSHDRSMARVGLCTPPVPPAYPSSHGRPAGQVRDQNLLALLPALFLLPLSLFMLGKVPCNPVWSRRRHAGFPWGNNKPGVGDSARRPVSLGP